MKKIFSAACAAALVCGLRLPVFAGCGDPSLYATFEMPELPEGVIEVRFDANGSWQLEGSDIMNYDLLPPNGDASDDVHLEIFVEPGYRVKAATLRIEAEDGSWSQEMTELKEGYTFFHEHFLPNAEDGVECVNYRTKPMPTFTGKSGTAKASVPVLELEKAEYNLHTEKIWDDYGNPAPDKAAIQSLLDGLKIDVTAKGVKKTYNSWAAFEEQVLGKDELYGFGETFKLKIYYPEGTKLDDNSGGPNVTFLYIEAGANYGGEIFDGGWRSCRQLSDYAPQGEEPDPDVHMQRNEFVTFTYDLNNYTAEWEFQLKRGSKIFFNEYELYFILENYSLPYGN